MMVNTPTFAAGAAAAHAQENLRPKHLVVDISAHGFGHLAQTAAVINALEHASSADTSIKLTIRSVADESTLRERIHRPFDLIPYRQDQGMIMHDALRVDAAATMDWYRDFHSNYKTRKSDAARELEALEPDLVFSDVPYLGLDAASLVGVPSVALCSLNWADIFVSYCKDFKGSARIHDDIQRAYSAADVFLRPEPSMPMESLDNTRPISPIAFQGRDRKDVLRSVAGIPDSKEAIFVLIGVGGVGIQNLPLDSWPRLDGVHWIFPDAALGGASHIDRRDFLRQSLFKDLRYIDLLASVQLVLTKTGYGTQTEAVLNRVPSICIERLDWPEHEYLREWHEEHGEVVFVDIKEIGTKPFDGLVSDLLSKKWTKNPISATGADEAANITCGYF